MVARFIQKYWRGKANYCHYDSHDKNSLLLLEPLLHDLRISLHSPSIACPRCPVPTKKDDTKVRLFPFRALCCCPYFFVLRLTVCRAGTTTLADLVFGKRTSGHFGGNIQDDFFLHDVSPWVSWIFFSKRVEIAGSPANTSFAVGYFVTCQMGYLHLLQLKKFTRTRPLSGPGTYTY